MTMNVKVGNVDTLALRTYINENWDQFDDSVRNEGKADISQQNTADFTLGILRIVGAGQGKRRSDHTPGQCAVF